MIVLGCHRYVIIYGLGPIKVIIYRLGLVSGWVGMGDGGYVGEDQDNS